MFLLLFLHLCLSVICSLPDGRCSCVLVLLVTTVAVAVVLDVAVVVAVVAVVVVVVADVVVVATCYNEHSSKLMLHTSFITHQTGDTKKKGGKVYHLFWR